MLWDALNSCLGVEFKIISDNNYSCRYCLLLRSGNSVTITERKEITGTLSAIIEALPAHLPVALVLTGKGIVYKNISFDEKVSVGQAFQVAFPSIAQQDFYVQLFGQEKNHQLSIVRKATADELLGRLKQAGFKIHSLSIGLAVTAHTWPLLNIYNSPLRIDGHAFELDQEKTFVSCNPTEESNQFQIKIGEEPVSEGLILAYAAAFQLLLYDKLEVIIADADQINTARLNFVQTNRLKQYSMVFLFGMFGMLLISFVLFSYYNDENSVLSVQVGEKTSTEDQLQALNANIKTQEETLNLLNWNGGYNYGYLVNELGKSMPGQIKLIEISMPGISDTGFSKIKLSGSTANLAAVNNWIYLLKEKTWIKAVKLLKYQEATDTDEYFFNIEINY